MLARAQRDVPVAAAPIAPPGGPAETTHTRQGTKPEKVYRDALKEIDKALKALHNKYEPNPTKWRGVVS